MNNCGIYKIQSVIKPERIYIGSTVNFKSRKSGHLGYLRQNKHHSLKLQRHYDKYGESDLTFSIIVECNKSDLLAFEQFYLDSLNCYFNICRHAGNCLGVKQTEESKRKKSESQKGEKSHLFGTKLSKERRAKLTNSLPGHSVSQETKDKISKTRMEKGLGKNRLGQTHSEESKNKMRKSALKRKYKNNHIPISA